jgi:hypothetical protein
MGYAWDVGAPGADPTPSPIRATTTTSTEAVAITSTSAATVTSVSATSDEVSVRTEPPAAVPQGKLGAHRGDNG